MSKYIKTQASFSSFAINTELPEKIPIDNRDIPIGALLQIAVKVS